MGAKAGKKWSKGRPEIEQRQARNGAKAFKNRSKGTQE
jgi:hypothetical protein